MPSQTIWISDGLNTYIVQTKDDEQSVGQRAQELAEKGKKAEERDLL